THGAAAARGDETVFAGRQRSPRTDPVEPAAVPLGVDVDHVLSAYPPTARAAPVGNARPASDLEVAIVFTGLEAHERHLAGFGRDHEHRLAVRRAVLRLVPGQHELIRTSIRRPCCLELLSLRDHRV